MRQDALVRELVTRGLMGNLISWPYGLMYHSRAMRAGRSSSSVLEKSMAGLRRDGKEPGRFASSTLSLSSVDDPCGVNEERAVGALGWEMLFWPVMMSLFESETEMWWVKFVFMAGKTEVNAGTRQIVLRR